MTRVLQEVVEEGEGGLAVRLKDLLRVWFAGAMLFDVYIFFITHIRLSIKQENLNRYTNRATLQIQGPSKRCTN